jgi:glyoxylase-like metal-dependent hydrolase (beta-lactamase superfamily II)
MTLPSWCTLVRADNPGPMTLDGTNTYLLRGSPSPDAVVVDPGPLDESHLEAVAGRGPVGLVLLTHGHPDHAEGAQRFHEMTGAPIAAADVGLVVGADPLRDGMTFDLDGGLAIEVLATPGHTSDSVSFLVRDAVQALLTGDTILGRGTTVVAHPDGVLEAYLSSLQRIRDLGPITLLPGHGPVRDDASAVAGEYLAHRMTRLAEVRATVAAGARSPREVVERVYADVDRAVWPAAEQSVRAQLDYLAAHG